MHKANCHFVSKEHHKALSSYEASRRGAKLSSSTAILFNSYNICTTLILSPPPPPVLALDADNKDAKDGLRKVQMAVMSSNDSDVGGEGGLLSSFALMYSYKVSPYFFFVLVSILEVLYAWFYLPPPPPHQEDKTNAARNAQDPEIQKLLQDPYTNQILQEVQDPARYGLVLLY